MRALIFVLLALTGAASASESAHFWGKWEPRPMLREFWRPVSDKWWSCNKRDECGPDRRLRKRCEEFARTHSPEMAIPEFVLDLCIYASEANDLVYSSIMVHWPRRRVLHSLELLRGSRDPCVRSIAEQLYEDFIPEKKA